MTLLVLLTVFWYYLKGNRHAPHLPCAQLLRDWQVRHARFLRLCRRRSPRRGRRGRRRHRRSALHADGAAAAHEEARRGGAVAVPVVIGHGPVVGAEGVARLGTEGPRLRNTRGGLVF